MTLKVRSVGNVYQSGQIYLIWIFYEVSCPEYGSIVYFSV